MREIIATGKDTEQAIEAGLLELNVAREDVKIEILETNRKLQYPKQKIHWMSLIAYCK